MDGPRVTGQVSAGMDDGWQGQCVCVCVFGGLRCNHERLGWEEGVLA